MTRFLLGCLFMALSFEAGEQNVIEGAHASYCTNFKWLGGVRCAVTTSQSLR